MKTINFIILFCSSLNVLLAFPFDYNQTDVDKTDEALQNFKDAILDPNFILMLNEFESKFLPINKHVEKRINDIYLYSSNRLREIEENSKDINADLDNCKENLNMPKVEEFYESYNEKCVKPISFLGKNIFSIGYDQQQVVFKNKYGELMDGYRGCLSPGDPAPYICAGIIIATNEEVRRISPKIKAYGLETERQLNQEILHLTECANTEISVASQRIQTEFDKAKECILNKIILA